MSVAGPVLAQAGAALAAFVLTATLTEPARRLALRYGLTDRPAGYKAHRRPTPYLGGLAIALGTLVPLLVVYRDLDPTLWLVVAAALVAAGLGLLDDIRGLSARARLAVETVLATAVALTGSRLGLPGPRWLDVLLTIGWIVVVMNSFNLLDNADGALATVASVTAAPVALSLYAGGQATLGLLLICLSASCAGFLLHNAPPARIFMGDAGSLFIGFLIATAATRIHLHTDGFGGVTVILLIAFVATVDTCLVLLSRGLHHRPLWKGHNDHVTHRLHRIGLGTNTVLITLLLVGVVSGLLAVLVAAGHLPGSLLLWIAGSTAVAMITLLLRIPGYPPPSPTAPPSREVAPPSREVTPQSRKFAP